VSISRVDTYKASGRKRSKSLVGHILEKSPSIFVSGLVPNTSTSTYINHQHLPESHTTMEPAALSCSREEDMMCYKS
jgi:hypothetical protein